MNQNKIEAERLKKLDPTQVGPSADFFHELVEVRNEETIKDIPEPVFREYFLPLFKLMIKPEALTEEEIKDKEERIRIWFSVVGDRLHSARIIAEDGSVLFEIPALYQTDLISAVRDEDSPSFSEIILTAEATSHLSLNRAKQIAEQGAEMKLSRQGKSLRRWLKSQKEFAKMYAYYKVLDELPQTKDPEPESDDFFDFD